MADVRRRLEQVERTLRRLTLWHDGLLASTGNGLEGVDPLRPWGDILRQAIHSADYHAMAYWSVVVEKKCLLLCAASSQSIVASGRRHCLHQPFGGSPSSSFGIAPASGKRAKRTSPGAHRTPSDGARAEPRRRARPASKPQASQPPTQPGVSCKSYNVGLCLRTPCPNFFAHRCAMCNRTGHAARGVTQPLLPRKTNTLTNKAKSKGNGKQRRSS